jgi:hypothetical protein
MLIIGYFELKESLLAMSTEFRKLGYDVKGFPLMYHLVNKKTDHQCVNLINAEISSFQPDVVLWWYFGYSVDILSLTRGQWPDKLFVMYNWDDPFTWSDAETHRMSEKARNFDIAFTSCEESVSMYLQHGSKQAHFLSPGVDMATFFPERRRKEYKHDVSIVCTNLYENEAIFSDQIVNRKKLVDELVSIPGITVGVYGPEEFRKIYPKNYVSFAKYHELNDVFNRSRINVCTHVSGSKYKYVNERCGLILASGGLLYVDKTNGIEEVIDEKGCVFIDAENVAAQIKDILANYDKYDEVKRIGYDAVFKFRWSVWAEFVHTELFRKKVHNNHLELLESS